MESAESPQMEPTTPTPSTGSPKQLRDMTETELRDYEVPKISTMEDLLNIIGQLTAREHDYGTAVYAVSIAAYATFRYMSGQQGINGFQASCADMDIFRRVRNLKHPFMIVDLGKLLYPQDYNDRVFPTHEQLLKKHIGHFQVAALELIGEDNENIKKGMPGVHAEVKKHWEQLANGLLPGEEPPKEVA